MPATFRPRGSAFCTHSVRGRFRGGSSGETLEVAGPGAGFAALPGLEGRAAGQAHGLAKRFASVRPKRAADSVSHRDDPYEHDRSEQHDRCNVDPSHGKPSLVRFAQRARGPPALSTRYGF